MILLHPNLDLLLKYYKGQRKIDDCFMLLEVIPLSGA